MVRRKKKRWDYKMDCFSDLSSVSDVSESEDRQQFDDCDEFDDSYHDGITGTDDPEENQNPNELDTSDSDIDTASSTDSETFTRLEFSSESEDEDFYEISTSETASGHFEMEDYRLICYMNFVLNEGISLKSLKRLEAMMTVLYGVAPPISYQEIKKRMWKVKEETIKQELFFCISCGTEKAEKRDACLDCSRPCQNISDTVTIITCDFIKQINDVMNSNGREIIEAHKNIHEGRNAFSAHDVRRFDGYQTQMETTEQFSEGVVHLIYTISSDGARFKRICKREATPMLMRIEGLDLLSKTGGKCMVLISMAYSDGGIKKELTEEFLRRSLEEIKNMKIIITIDGKNYTFLLKLLSYLADMKEQRSLCGLPNWQCLEGCSKCRTIGAKDERRVTFNDAYTAPARTNEDLLWAAENGKEGFSELRVPFIYTIFPPLSIALDPFHLKAAGICKFLLEEISKPNRWNCNMKPGVMNDIRDALKNVKKYTYDTVQLLDLKRVGKATGREVEKLSLHLCAIIGFTGGCQENDYNVLFFGLYTCLQFSGTNIANPGNLQLLMDRIYELLVFLAPNSITLKWHCFLKHLVNHENKFGPLYNMEPFEREHKTFMTSLHFQTTNSEYALITRYVGGQTYKRKLNYILNKLSTQVASHVNQTMKKRADEEPFDNFKNCNIVPRNIIMAQHIQMIDSMVTHTKWISLKRVALETRMGSFQFSSMGYWKNDKSTTSTITFLDAADGAMTFGEILLIFSCDNSINFIVREFLVDPQAVFQCLSESPLSPAGKAALECTKYFPTSFAKITGFRTSYVPSSSLLSPATVISYKGNNYVKMHR